MELLGNVKNYEWGKIGSTSLVAQLAEKNSTNFKIEKNTYSELWMGDHVSGPSVLKSTSEPLSSNLKRRLPFLFKVLSIQKALSIQVHPNKAEAERLHKKRPDIYKDPNHKPELAIALTPFQALCGFRPHHEIYQFCKELPPLLKLVGGDAKVEALKTSEEAHLKACYEKLMTSNASDISDAIKCIIDTYENVLIRHNLKDLFDTINKEFPNDVGVLSLFFLNVLNLNPGDAIFLGANEIHAYISGDCIECMACSDNVIRAGLTPKFKDVNQLIACLNYAGSPPDAKLFKPKKIDEHVLLFVPPVKDFAVARIGLPSSMQTYKLKIPATESILLVLQGERMLRIKGHSDLIVKRGSIIYIPPDAAPEIEISIPSDCQSTEDFIAYQAMENIFD